MKKIWANCILLIFVFMLLFSIYGFRPEPLFHLSLSLDTTLTINTDGTVSTVELIRLPRAKEGTIFKFSLLHSPNHIKDLKIAVKHPVEVEYLPYNRLLERASDVLEYTVSTENNRMDISMPLQSSDKELWIEVSYLLSGSLINHFDTSQLFFRCIQFSEKTFLANWKVTAFLSKVSEPGEIVSWIRSSGKANLTIYSETELLQAVSSQALNFPPYAQILVPVSSVPSNYTKSLEFSLSSIIQGEQLMDTRINEAVKYRKTVWFWAWFSLMLSIAYLLISWCKNIRCFKRNNIVKQLITEAPDSLRPAELGLMARNGKVNIRDMIATMFDLAIRGYIQIEEYVMFVKEGEKKSHSLDYRMLLQDQPRDLLSTYEIVFLQTMFQEFSLDKKTISFYEIRKIFSRTPKLFERFWKKWLKELRKRAIILNFFDQRVTQRQVFLKIAGVLVIIPSALASFALLAFFTEHIDLIPLTVSFMTSGLLMVAASFFFKRRSDASENSFAKYNAYRNYLAHFKGITSSHYSANWTTLEKALPWVLIWEMEKNFFAALKKCYQRTKASEEIFAGSFYRSSLSENSDDQIITNIESMTSTSFQVFSAGLRTVRKSHNKG